MALKRTANKRKQTSNNLTRNRRRRTTPPAYKNASQPEQDHSPASETFWAATRILQDNGTHYLVEWDGIDPATSSPYEPTWEPHDFVTPALEAEWKETIAAQSAVARHTQGQAQSYGEASNQTRSTHELLEPPLPAHCLTEKAHQCQSASTAFPQQMQQSRCDSSSLFVGSQESECEFENSGLRSCGVVLTSQSNNGSASYTTTTSKEVSVSNQHKSATVNGAGDTDEEDLSAIDPAALVLRHGSHDLPPASIKRADSVGTAQQLLRLELAEKIQEGGQESKSPESLIQEELELLEQGGLEAHAPIFKEKELLSPALLAAEMPSEVEEQQEMQGEPEIRGTSPSAPASETIDGQSEFPAEGGPVFQTGTRRKTDLKEAVPALPSGETVQEQIQALECFEQPLEGIFEGHEAREEDVIRHAPASPNVCEGFDGPTRLLARSEQSISPSPQQSGLTEQHILECTHTLPVSSIDITQTEPSATSSRLTSMLEPRITGEQTFTKQVVTAPARGESVEVCLLLATTPTEWAPDISERVNLDETEAGRLPPPPALNQSTRTLGVMPVQEAPHFIRNSMHTIHGKPTGTGHNLFTQKPPSCEGTDQSSVPRQSVNGCLSVNHSISPINASVNMPLNSPSRRMRSTLDECNRSPEMQAVDLRPRLGPSTSASCSGSPICQKRLQNVELAQQRILPPIDHPEPNKGWTTKPRELSRNDKQRPQHRDPRPMERFHSNTTPVPELHAPMNSMSESSSVEGAGTTELTRATVQVEPKKRKRPFMKRTKTGCGTCRRRKKKCDEAKPKCNNCERNGFICAGYAYKVPRPKNVVAKPLPSLQAQKRMPTNAHQLYSRLQGYDLAHILNCEPSLGSSQSTYADPNAPNGSIGDCDRPITVEEQEHQPPASSRGTGRDEPSRVLYPPGQPLPPTSYPQRPPAPAPVHERDASHDHRRGTHSIQVSPPPRHRPRVCHETPHSMSQIITNSPAVAVGAHQRTKQPPQYPSLSTSTTTSPGAVYRFNNTSNAIVGVAQSKHEYYFKGIVEATWAQPRHGESPFGGYITSGAYVSTPFHYNYSYNVSIGDNIIIRPNCQLLDSARIAIKRNTKISAHITITTLRIPTDTKALKGSYGTKVTKAVYIGENVYISNGCIVGAGVRISNGAIVRSRSVVVHNIPLDYIASSNPANMHKAN
ncbi:hypothetical protein GQ44DRAFT_733544 [Phaeosphaeriaceae sp. PMI808]|nr:hypothetical protein GQ44DRAFT_733544 [Phaeosphaeriaceae sp. PMI808]